MMIHLGGETVVRTREIIGIFDLEKTSVAEDTRAFLRNRRYKVQNASYDMPKSFVVAERRGETTVYISSISPATLRKRRKSGRFLENKQ